MTSCLRRLSALVVAASLACGVPARSTAQDGPPATTAAPAGIDETQTIAAARQTYQRLLEENRFDEAIAIAQQIVDLTTRRYGEHSTERAAAIGDLAAAQLRHDDVASAEINYKTAIGLIERAESVGSPLLVAPLTGLGDTYMKSGLAAQARETYDLALRANHAAAGFYNVEQVPILDGLSESYLALDKVVQANAQQRYQVTIQRRHTGPDSPELAPALDKLARWYNRTGQYVEAREAYQAEMNVIRKTRGNDTSAIVDTLSGQAVTFLNEGNVAASAGLLKHALEVLDAQPEKDHLKRADVLVDLGDVYTLSRQPRSARKHYVEAWTELSGDEALLGARERNFGAPVRIAGPRLPKIVGADGAPIAAPRSSGLADGFVVASLTVDASGVARDAVIVESSPAGLLDKQLLRVLKDTAFRPQMSDAETVASQGIQYRHDFHYVPTPGGANSSAKPGRDEDQDKPIAYPGESGTGDDEPRR